MNGDDLARLAVAKRAFVATQPSEREVQTGVRRARLSLERRKPRRRWFSKGLVMVVLAAGGLAYAKPHAFTEVVARVMPAAAPDREGASGGARAPRAEQPETTLPKTTLSRAQPRQQAAGLTGPAEATTQTFSAPEAANEGGHALRDMPRSGALAERGLEAENVTATEAPNERERERPLESVEPRSQAGRAEPGVPARSGATASRGPARSAARAAAAAEPARELTDWGRVGDALVRGDEQQALAALSSLSESDDPRTRDKADLGRAQLLMAHGNPEQACAIARSLSHRRAGARIERQAQVLLKSCR